MSNMRNLLVADGSSYSAQTTQMLGHSISPSGLASLQAEGESEARKITTKAEKQLLAKGYRTASVVIRGGGAESILAAAKEHSPDSIAVESRGLPGIESLLLGSVAERMARYANCSVLIGRAAK